MEDIRIVTAVQNGIEEMLEQDKGKKIIIFPYGELGRLAKRLLNECYGCRESLIIDNHYAKYNPNIKGLDYLNCIEMENYTLLFACQSNNEQLYKILVSYFPEKRIHGCTVKSEIEHIYTTVGKYSYGPLCEHPYVESVGAFCSIAAGADVVGNHAVNYISTHDFLTAGNDPMQPEMQYEDYSGRNWYFSGVKPIGAGYKRKKTRIGNDVWIGANVIITNGSDIGNGVIAGAGAVITKSVPDYAVVMGIPARIVRYRYTQQQIDALNKIQWWNWSDEKIRDCYRDFYEDVDVFIKKHMVIDNM